MPTPTPHRGPREWLWLMVSLALVGGVCVPLWRYFHSPEKNAELLAKWNERRLGQLLIGPEQIACYVFFTWASLILLGRYREVLRQRNAFYLDLLPTDEGARILPEDARPLMRKLDQIVAKRGPYILANMVRLGLGKYAISKSGPDVAEIVRNQAEVEQNRLIVSMGTVQYLTWGIPALGFLGTVRGLAGGMSLDPGKIDRQKFLEQVTDQLSIAFDCTFVALALSVVLMYLLHAVQKAEDLLIIRCQEYCQEHLLLRLYDPQP